MEGLILIHKNFLEQHYGYLLGLHKMLKANHTKDDQLWGESLKDFFKYI